MNGRVYYPLVARLLSRDPVITDPMNGQSYNRCSCVWNNPTNLTDPTGFDPEMRTKNGTVCEDQPRSSKDKYTGYFELVYQNSGERAGTASNERKDKDEAQKSGSSKNTGTTNWTGVQSRVAGCRLRLTALKGVSVVDNAASVSSNGFNPHQIRYEFNAGFAANYSAWC